MIDQDAIVGERIVCFQACIGKLNDLSQRARISCNLIFFQIERTGEKSRLAHIQEITRKECGVGRDVNQHFVHRAVKRCDENSIPLTR